jgi:hypothetical protein
LIVGASAIMSSRSGMLFPEKVIEVEPHNGEHLSLMVTLLNKRRKNVD